MHDPLNVATDGYLDSPLGVATDGWLTGIFDASIATFVVVIREVQEFIVGRSGRADCDDC